MIRKKYLSSVCAVALTAALICGCGGSGVSQKRPSYDKEKLSTDISDELIAQNENYRLEINRTSLGVSLTDLKTGKVYGTNPVNSGGEQFDEFGMPIKRHPQIESVLFIEYLDVQKNTTSKLISYNAAVQNGRTVLENTDNGVKVEYYFDDAEIMIPITYSLRENGLKVTLDPKEIEEGGNMLISVSVAPFFCSVENTEKNGYLLYPSGSGALIYPKEVSQPGDSYSAEVYGEDASKEKWDKTSTEKSIRLPVYGAKSGDTAAFAIIEKGADSCLLETTVGSTSIGYSAVYATYQLRGYTANIKELYNNRYYKGLVYSDNMTDAPLEIGFYPLAGENADYSGMARLYRSCIEKTEGKAENAKAATLNITAVGGTMISKSFLGVPYTTLLATTTLKDAAAMVKELEEGGAKVSALALSGFGKTGIDSVKPAGGFGIAGKLGSSKDFTSLKKTCENSDTDLFFDFDAVTFSKSGGGLSSYFDSAVRANRKRAKVYDYNIALLGRETDSAYSLTARNKLTYITNKIIKKAGAIPGIGLSSLSNTAYSDYTDKSSGLYYAKSGMTEQVSEIIENVKKSGKKFMSSEANAYAAVKSDVIFNSPARSNAALIFDDDIPFYQMVLRGRTALSTESLNLATDREEQLLKAVEGGMGLAYTLTAKYDTKLIDSGVPVFYNSLYSDLKDGIVSDSKMLSELYGKIGNSAIKSHKIHGSGLRETVYENGVTVFVNYSSGELNSPAGSVRAHGFLIWEERV